MITCELDSMERDAHCCRFLRIMVYFYILHGDKEQKHNRMRYRTLFKDSIVFILP